MITIGVGLGPWSVFLLKVSYSILPDQFGWACLASSKQKQKLITITPDAT